MDKMETKKVYVFDGIGQLLGTHVLDYTDRSPISGCWQIPANMTATMPPAPKDGYNLYWTGMIWEYKENPKQEDAVPIDTPTTTAQQPTLAERVAALEAVANKTVMG